MRTPTGLAVIGLVLSLNAAAFAQAGADTRPPEAPGPTVPTVRPGETLSEGLNRTDGVIPPPRTMDPGLTRPAPPVGTTPVLPPPDQQTTPK